MKIRTALPAWLAIFLSAAALYADTTLAPVVRLRDVNTRAPQDSFPQILCKNNGVIYFKANDQVQGFELWRTDGTPDGTFLLKDATPGMEHSGFDYECFGSTPNGLTYLRIYTPFNGWELWRTDGSIAGTQRFVEPDRNPDVLGGFFVGFLGNRVLYVPRETPFNQELWISDGTAAGTQRLKTFPGAPDNGTTKGFTFHTPAGDKLLFAVHAGGLVIDLWISDGTVAGTQLLANMPWGTSGYSFAQVGSYALFKSANPSQWGDDLWRTDGTFAGTVQLTPSPPAGVSSVVELDPVVLGSVAVFRKRTNSGGVETVQLWRTDGTPANTQPIPGPGADLEPVVLWDWHRIGNRLLFVGKTAATGQELWSTDGTDAGTQLLADIAPGTANSNPTALFGPQEGGYEVFMAQSPNEGNEPWVTDGTPAGTRLVANLSTAGNSTTAAGFTGDTTRGFLLVQGAPSFGYIADSYQLYRYSPADNQLASVREFRSDVTAVLRQIAGGRALMMTNEPGHDRELWTSDGTAGGTMQLPEIAKPAVNLGSEPRFIGVAGSLALFSAINNTDFSGTYALWRTDGVHHPQELDAEKFYDVQPMGTGVALPGNRLLFAGYYQAYGIEPWITDGLTQINLVKDINPDRAFSMRETCAAKHLVALNNMAYFPAADASGGEELWRSDGTSAGTARVSDIEAGTGDSSPCNFAVMGNVLYFAATRNGDRELWRSDGTDAGTQRVADIRSGASSGPAHLTAFGNALYFVATGDSGRRELWRSDGTSGGTARVADVSADPARAESIDGLVVAGNRLFFTACSDGSSPGCHLWGTDGTLAGTVSLAGSEAAIRFGLRSVGVSKGKLLFVGSDGSTGRELWISDGTPGGTHLLADLNPSGDGDPVDFTDFHGVPYFRASTGAGTTQLWKTDGTASGTIKVSTMSVGDSPNEAGLGRWSAIVLNQQLLFAADDGSRGMEPWSHENLAPTPAADSATATSGVSTAVAVTNNDSDPDGSIDPATVTVVALPASGTATVDTATGNITYRSNSGFSGSDQFTYRVSDNQGRSSGTVTVSVTVNAAPSGSGGGSGGGGGGTMTLGTLLALLVLLIASRLRFKRSLDVTI